MSFSLICFSYALSAVLAFLLISNLLVGRRGGVETNMVTPRFALFLAAIWPIGLVAAFLAFVRRR